MNTEYSYANAIFNHTLKTIDYHKAESNNWGDGDPRNMKQALDWWNRLPEFAKENLRNHTFLGKETFNTVYDFYWGE